MKKIGSYEESRRKSKRNTLIMGGVMLFMLLASTAGYSFVLGGHLGFGNSQEGNSNEGVGNQHNQNIGGSISLSEGDIFIRSKVYEIREVPADIFSKISDLSGENVYIDGGDNEIFQSIGGNIQNYVGRFQEGCYGKCERDLPELDCSSNLIIFKASSERKIRQEENCFFIDGDFVSAEAFVYRLFGGT